jgi:signal transduction histidine kinase
VDRDAPALPGDFDSLSLQRSAFTALNLLVLAVLLGLHVSFASFWGRPSLPLTILLGVCIGARILELWRVRGRVLRPAVSAALTSASIALNLALAIVLATVIDREDSQYFALLAVPILESAFRFGLVPTVAVTAAADSIAFYWVWRYYHAHPPVDIGEYFEAGTISLIFLIVAILVSVMVRQLTQKQEQLARNIAELKQTRERLLQEEKLAAVGRLSSALAHEIRNPVAMIYSSLATARALAGPDREEMLEIAKQESSRLVALTNDLLAYARPRKPLRAIGDLRAAVLSTADACRAHAGAKEIALQVHAPGQVMAAYDDGLLQQALMNLIMNAVDAAPSGSQVTLSVKACGADEVQIDVENRGGPIPSAVVERLFEPFFTTRAAGTGLGLATARSAVLTQGGNLVLAANSETVRFSLLLPRHTAVAAATAVA